VQENEAFFSPFSSRFANAELALPQKAAGNASPKCRQEVKKRNEPSKY
jgi:hypothetical protein